MIQHFSFFAIFCIINLSLANEVLIGTHKDIANQLTQIIKNEKQQVTIISPILFENSIIEDLCKNKVDVRYCTKKSKKNGRLIDSFKRKKISVYSYSLKKDHPSFSYCILEGERKIIVGIDALLKNSSNGKISVESIIIDDKSSFDALNQRLAGLIRVCE